MRSSIAAFVLLSLIGFSSASRLCNIRSCANSVDDERSVSSLSALAYNAKTYNVIPGSYRVNGGEAELFPGGKVFPVTLQTTETNPGHIEVTLRVVNTIMYGINYNTKDGWVSNISPGISTLMSGSDHEMTVETRLAAAIAATQQLGFEKDGLLSFINDQTGSRIAFFPAVNQPVTMDHISWIYPGLTGLQRYTVVDGSYQVNGQRVPLFPSYHFPVTVETSEVIAGRLDVTLKVVNTVSYQIYYNIADGWVSNIVPGFSTVMLGTYEQMEVENKLKAIISITQQLAFEKDGLLQFITNNSATRVAFKPQQYRQLEAEPARQLQGAVPKYYEVISGSYRINGHPQQLFPLEKEFPLQLQTTEVYPGCLHVILTVFNTLKYEINFNVADGWVSSINPGPSTTNQGPINMIEVENKLKGIIGYAQQVAFETDGIQFIKDNSATRIAFRQTQGNLEGSVAAAPSATVDSASIFRFPIPFGWNLPWNRGVVKRYNVVAGSYQVIGKNLPLFNHQPVYVHLKTTEGGYGRLTVTLTVVNITTWEIYYNPADGWVVGIHGGFSTRMTGPPDALDVENRLSAIIGSTQQLSFERDGLLQFIKDHSATRVAFTPI